MEYFIAEEKKEKKYKKFISFLCRTLSLVVSLSLALFLFNVLYVKTDKDLQNNSIVGMQLVGNRIYSDGSATQEQIDIVNNFLDSLNLSIKNKYTEQSWLIILAKSAPTTLTTKTITFTNTNYDHSVYNALGGLTIPNGKIIYLNTKVDTIEKFKENLAHEFGHCIDFFAGYPSHTDENITIYQKYSVNKDIFDDYESSNIIEFFASAYKEYVLNPDLIKEEAPEIYDFMDTTEKLIEEKSSIFINIPGYIRCIVYNFKGLTGNL